MPPLSGLAVTDSNRCVINAMGGTTHNYSYCIRPPEQVVTQGQRSLTMANVGKVFGELENYIAYLIVKPDKVTAAECKDAGGVPLLGNKYVLKTSLKCIPVDKTTGKTICNNDNTPKEKTLYKYINNVSTGSSFITGGRDVANGNGLIQSLTGNVEKLAYNIIGVAGSFAQESKPYCVEAKVNCHIVAGQDSVLNYSGPSPGNLHFSLSDITKMRADSFIDGKPNVPLPIINSCISGVVRANFNNIEDNTEDTTEDNTKGNTTGNTNIEDTIDYINKNIINQNSDKIIYSSNIDTIIDSINFEDSALVQTYYLGLSLFMLLIIFKLLYGKQTI